MHKKIYNTVGTGVYLSCEGVPVIKSQMANANFSLNPCWYCGQDVKTTGNSPETDKIQEYVKCVN